MIRNIKLSEKLYLPIILTVFSLLFLQTFIKHPVTGDDPARGLSDKGSNVFRIRVFNKINEKVDVSKCSSCFFKNSYINSGEVKDGIHYSQFHPTTYFVKDNKRYPINLAARRGGINLTGLKSLFNFFDIKTSLVLYNYILSICTLIFFFLTFKTVFSSKLSFAATLFYSLSPGFLLHSAPFLSEQSMETMIWISTYFLVKKWKLSYLFTIICMFLGLYFKVTFLCFFPLFLVLNKYKSIQCLAAASLIYLCYTFYFNANDLIFHEFVERGESYFKPFRFWVLGLFDLLPLFSLSSTSFDQVLNFDEFIYPLDFNHLYPAINIIDFTNIFKAKFFEALAFIISILFIYYFAIKKRNIEITKIAFACFGSWFLLICVTHMWASFGSMLQPLMGIVAVLMMLLAQAIRRSSKIKYKKVILVSFTLFVAFNSLSFVYKFRTKGPIAQYSFNFYNEISKYLIEQKINKPIMLLTTEIGMVEFISREKIIPYYVKENSILKLEDIFSMFPSGNIVLLLNAEWTESETIKDITYDDIVKISSKLDVEITKKKYFNYRGKKKAVLFYFENKNKNIFKEISTNKYDEKGFYQIR
jgi:hypothetical protein